MKRLINFLCVILFAAGLLSCASSAGLITYDVSYSTNADVSPVYRISRNGNVMFVGGSIHVLRKTDFPLPQEFDYAFSVSDALALETDVDQLQNPDITQYLLDNMYLPAGQTLTTVLSPQTYEMLSQACDDFGIPVLLFETMKPSMVINVLSTLQIESIGFEQLGVDFYYFEKAKNENKPVVFLESVQVQIDTIVSVGEGYEDDYVQYSLQDMDAANDDIDTLVAEWRNGITTSVNAELDEMINDWPLIYKAMITDRHDTWFPQLEQFLASGNTYFIIVGYAHLPGPNGILQYFRSIGCTVEQVAVNR